MTPSLSAILIAKNEERDLLACLETLKGLVSEVVIVVSADTTDRTEEIARAAGAKVSRRKFDDYARMRQASLDAATSAWCLWIDPDERVTPELADEIRQALATDPPFVAVDIPFSIRFLGHTMAWGGLGSEHHIRLFRRTKARFTGGALHESLAVDGAVAVFQNKIIHEPYRDVDEYMSKLDRYTTLAAEKRFDAGKRFTPFHHFIYPWELFSRLVLKLGFLDGVPGVTWARLAAYHSRLKYGKLKRMQEEKIRP